MHKVPLELKSICEKEKDIRKGYINTKRKLIQFENVFYKFGKIIFKEKIKRRISIIEMPNI